MTLSTRRWIPEEDKDLLKAVEESQGKKSLRQIFSEFGAKYGRSVYSCFGRYYHLTRTNTGPQKKVSKRGRKPKTLSKAGLRAAFKRAAEASGGRLTAGAIEKIAQEHGVPYHHALSVWGMMHAGGEVFALERDDLLKRIQELADQNARLLIRLQEVEAAQERVVRMEEILEKLRAALK
ncbi:MAG: hypothetical protein QXI12_12465 [Candidatus Methanomethyliaceae archaeon]